MKENEENTDGNLSDIRAKIESELENIDRKPYSDTIISIQLEEACRCFGQDVKDQLIDEFDLDKYGWSKGVLPIKRSNKYKDSEPLL